MQRRRTQAERSSETQERILAATQQCLIEVGYSKTTTKAIEQRAGVTRGAVLHHYPSKADLLGAAAAYMAVRWQDQLIAAMDEIGENLEPGDFIDAMWRQFSHPLSFAILEMQNAARFDPVLREVLSKCQRSIANRFLPIAAAHLGVAKDDPDFITALELTWQFMSGAAGLAVTARAGADQERLNAEWRRMITPMLQPRVSAASSF